MTLLAPLVECRPPERAGAFGALAPREVAGCCTDFRVGYDMLVTEFGVDPSVRAGYGAFAQAMGDYVALSTRMVDDVTGACRTLALEFGGNPDDPAVRGRSGPEATYAWCNFAARRLTDAFNDSLQPAGHFKAHFAPADCWLDTSTLARCESACSADAACEEKSPVQRCDKDQLVGACTGKCSGACLGSAAVPASCDGTCEASCEGTCTGSCYGTCEGVIQAGGRCKGTCMGTCEGSCRGRCTGACRYGRLSAGRCDGACRGACTTPFVTTKCGGDLGPPKCPVDASCEANCKAIAQAHASCSVPSVNIALGDDISKEITADMVIQTKLRVLERELPKLINAVSARGPQLEAEAKGAFEAGSTIVQDKVRGATGKLGLKGSACAAVMQTAGEQALQDFHLASEAAKVVLKTLPTPKG